MYKTRKMTKEERKRWLKVWNSYLLHPIQLLLIIPFILFIIFLKVQFESIEMEYHLINETNELNYYIHGMIFVFVLWLSVSSNRFAFNILEKLLHKKGYSMDLPNNKKLNSKNISDYLKKKFGVYADLNIYFIEGQTLIDNNLNESENN